MTVLRPFFSFYGSKWRLAPKYPAPRYDTIIEPFAGSAGYSLHYPERQVILVEKDPIIAAIWRWLIAAHPDDILSLPCDLVRGDTLANYDMPQEARWLMGFWVGHARCSPAKTVTKFGDDPDEGSYFSRFPVRCAEQLKYISHWTIIEGDYSFNAPDVCATWFIDPPYQVAGKHYHNGASQINYDTLSAWCRKRKGQAMVCENSGANWLPFEYFSEVKNVTYGGERKVSAEVVWLNDAALSDRAKVA
jgi:hypothetical protein